MSKPLILLPEDNEGDVVLVNEALCACLSTYTLKVVTTVTKPMPFWAGSLAMAEVIAQVYS
jgi:hypothetical protein